MPDTNNSTDTNNQNNTDNQNNNANAGAKFTEVVLGCDSNEVNDAQVQAVVHKAIEAAGYKVHDLGIDPNSFANYSYTADAKGKAGVYLMAASLISFLDAGDANFDLNVLGIRGDVTGWSDAEWAKKPVPQDHDGNYTHRNYDKCAGMTYPQLNDMYKGKCVAVPGETPEKLAQNIVEALGGQYNGTGGGTVSSSGGGAQVKDKTFEHCIKRICAATDSIFLVENNAAVLFPYTDWMAFTLRHQINQIKAKDIDPDLFEIDYNTDGFYNKVTVVWGADGEEDKVTSDKENEEEKETVGNTTTIQKTMPTGGTKMSEQYDPLVDIYGELEKKVTTNFPNEETAHYVMNALLIQYIRDFNNSCRVRAIHNNKYIGGTFYAVENPNTKKSELFYLNSYTIFKEKDQPLVTDLEFKYGPEGAEELLDYQVLSGGTGGAPGISGTGSATEDQIWKDAAKCKWAQDQEDCSTNDPETAKKHYDTYTKQGKEVHFDCFGMSAYLYYRFNYEAKIPARVIGSSDHKVIELYKNNQWYKPIEEYRQLDHDFHYDDATRSPNAPVLLDAPNSPAGSSTNSNPSGNTANSNGNTTTK